MDLEYENQPLKFLHKVDRVLYKRLYDKIQNLLQNPFSTDSKRIQGKEKGSYRVRVGDYRIIYAINQKTLIIIKIEHRSKVYLRESNEEITTIQCKNCQDYFLTKDIYKTNKCKYCKF